MMLLHKHKCDIVNAGRRHSSSSAVSLGMSQVSISLEIHLECYGYILAINSEKCDLFSGGRTRREATRWDSRLNCEPLDGRKIDFIHSVASIQTFPLDGFHGICSNRFVRLLRLSLFLSLLFFVYPSRSFSLSFSRHVSLPLLHLSLSLSLSLHSL